MLPVQSQTNTRSSAAAPPIALHSIALPVGVCVCDA